MKNSAHISRIAPRAAVMFAIILAVAMAGGAWAMLSAQDGTGGESAGGGYVYNGVVAPTDGNTLRANLNGQMVGSCGVIFLDSWGTKTLRASDFPGCFGTNGSMVGWTVMCINEGNWTSKFVGNVTVSPDGKTLSFNAYQHGHCGLFPTG